MAPVLVLLVIILLPRIGLGQELNTEALSGLSSMIQWSGVLTSLFVVAVAWLALRLLRETVEGLSRRFAARRLVLQKIGTIFQFIIFVGAAIICIMLSFTLDEHVLTLVGGTLAVSIGFALKDLVASLFAAITIMMDRPFQVGDRVNFGGQYGDITAIGLRSVRLQTLDDNTVTIPNNKFLNDIVSSGNYGSLDMMVVIPFYIRHDQDVEKAIEIVRQAAITSKYVHIPKPVTVSVKHELFESFVALKLTVKAYVLDTKYERAFETDVTLRALAQFKEVGILLPGVAS